MLKKIELSELVALVEQKHLPVSGHSGKVVDGGVFVALPPAVPEWKIAENKGGEQYLAQVAATGVGYIVVSEAHAPLLESMADLKATFVVCPSTRDALGALAAASYGTDVACPKVLGITGTNGKTTESYLLEHLFTSLGNKVGIVGTVEYRWPGHHEAAPLTTPGCVELHSMLSAMHKAGTDWAFMEISSHALDQQRVAGIPFSGALMTNLTQDHLDYHENFEAYYDAKAKLFRKPEEGGVPLATKCGAINNDDPWGQRLLKEEPQFISYGIKETPLKGVRHLQGTVLSQTPAGLVLSMSFEGKQWQLASHLVGGFNAMNLLGAQATALALGVSIEDLQHLESFTGVPGRLERIANDKQLNVFVDYAHTPDALIKAMEALRAAGFKRIISVFGCGGNRDKTKRPLMGKAVAEYADIAVVTSDNPRHEEPESIIDDIMPGLAGAQEVHRQADRRMALYEALQLMTPDDALLVAGKGHETYQQIGDTKHPFSDQAILKEFLS